MIVIFGGTDALGNRLDDVWALRLGRRGGAMRWSELRGASTSAFAPSYSRIMHTMLTLSPLSTDALVFGGLDGNNRVKREIRRLQPANCDADAHDSDEIEGDACLPCDASCAECNGAGSSACTACPAVAPHLHSGSCSCDAGYTQTSDDCVQDDECAGDGGGQNCYDPTLCVDVAGSFTCSCPGGTVGDGVTCDDIDECTLAVDLCDAKATCTNKVGFAGSTSGLGYDCACSGNGYDGDGFYCTDIHECDLGLGDCTADAECILSLIHI